MCIRARTVECVEYVCGGILSSSHWHVPQLALKLLELAPETQGHNFTCKQNLLPCVSSRRLLDSCAQEQSIRQTWMVPSRMREFPKTLSREEGDQSRKKVQKLKRQLLHKEQVFFCHTWWAFWLICTELGFWIIRIVSVVLHGLPITGGFYV